MKDNKRTKKSLITPKKKLVVDNKDANVATKQPITPTGEKNKYKGISRLTLILINLVGFPVLTLIVGLLCKDYYDAGIANWMIYIPLIVVVLFWGLTALIQFIIFRSDKKRHRSFKHTMISSAVVPICVFAGFFLLLDTFMPKPLSGATSSTLFYEDLVEDGRGSHELIVSKARLFMDKNNLYKHEVDASGNDVLLPNGKPKPILDENGEKQYVRWFDKENQDIFAPIFHSFDLAYQKFNDLAIEYALSEPDLLGGITSGKIPITVLLSIILDTEDQTKYPNEFSNTKGLMQILTDNKTLLKDAIKGLFERDEDGNMKTNFSATIVDPYTGKVGTIWLDNLLNAVIHKKEYEGIEWSVLQLLGDNPLSNVDPNANIMRKGADGKMERVGACLGYQDMAWLNSVHLLEVICCLMECRKYFYLFGVLIGLLTYFGFILKKQHLLVTGEDLTILPRSKKRVQKELNKNYHFAKIAESTEELNLIYDEEEQKQEEIKQNKRDNKKNKKSKDNNNDKKLGKKSLNNKAKEAKTIEEVKPIVKEEKPVEEVKPIVKDEPVQKEEPVATEVKPVIKEEKPIIEEVKPEIKPVEQEPIIKTSAPIINEVKPEVKEEIKEEVKVEKAPAPFKEKKAPGFVPKGSKPGSKTSAKKLKF